MHCRGVHITAKKICGRPFFFRNGPKGNPSLKMEDVTLTAPCSLSGDATPKIKRRMDHSEKAFDEDITSLNTNNTSHMDMEDSITRAHRLNQHVSSFICSFSNYENSMVPNNVIVLRNT